MIGRWICAVFALSAAGCQTTPISSQTPDFALRLAQISGYFTRDQVLADRAIHEPLRKAGGNLDRVGGRTFALGRVQCCGGPNERETAIAFFVPDNVDANVGDVIEVRSGGARSSGTINVAVRVRERSGGTRCRWVPEDRRLWTRILYCDGLEHEGWEEQTGFWHFWIRRSSNP